MPTQRLSSRTHQLAAGERRVLRADGGSRWIVLRGEVGWSDPPRWLGERLVCIERALPAGAEHRCEGAGWIALQARCASTLVCEARAPLAARLRVAWRIIVDSAVERGPSAPKSVES